MKKDFFLKKKNFFNKKFNIIGDFDLFTRISKSNYFASIQEPLSIYRVHKESFSNQNYLMHINELKFWISDQVVFKDDYLYFIKEKIIYMEAILNLLNSKYFLTMKKILEISSLSKKIKLFFLLLIPNFIFRKLKNNF
jgi:hypothetical protein